MTVIHDVRTFAQSCDQTTATFNLRQAALYTGLQCEELAEKLHALGCTVEANLIDGLGNLFKRGVLDHCIEKADKVALLDADLDLTWVSVGAALSLGADVDKGWAKLTANNMTKVDPETGRARRHPATGKVMKPEGFQPLDLSDCF